MIIIKGLMPTSIFATGPLDLDDLRAHVAKALTAKRPCDKAR
jgi:hypothetical protein